MPAVSPLQPWAGYHDAYVSVVNPAGTTLTFSSNLGGGSDDLGHGIALGQGAVYVVGVTQPGSRGEVDFPLVRPLQPARAGSFEMFVFKVALTAPARPVIDGQTWYSDGSRSRSGPAGSEVAARAVGAVEHMPYQLVLTTGGNCATTVAVLNPTVIHVGPSRLIGVVRGVIPVGTPPGDYQVCFRHPDGATATGAARFIVG